MLVRLASSIKMLTSSHVYFFNQLAENQLWIFCKSSNFCFTPINFRLTAMKNVAIDEKYVPSFLEARVIKDLHDPQFQLVDKSSGQRRSSGQLLPGLYGSGRWPSVLCLKTQFKLGQVRPGQARLVFSLLLLRLCSVYLDVNSRTGTSWHLRFCIVLFSPGHFKTPTLWSLDFIQLGALFQCQC